MQDINTYIRRYGVKGSIVDAYNMSSPDIPSITIGMAVRLRLRLFDEDADETLPATAFSTIAAWNFAIDRDYNRTTEVLLRANTNISVDSDGIILIPIPDTNIQNLITALGTSESATYIAELAGYENGSTTPVLVLQFPIIVHNRVDPEPDAQTTPVTPSTLTLAQILALLGGELEFQFSADGESWHSTQAAADTYFRARNAAVTDAAWSAALTIPKGADGHTVDPDLVAPIAERPASPSGDLCFVASDEGKVYWYKSGTWTDGTPLTTVQGPQGIQGIQGPKGDTSTIAIGTVAAVPYGTAPSVTNSGTATAAEFDFLLPMGPQGLQGPQGPQGIQGLTGPAGDGLKIDATGTLANRHEYDNASAKFRYMATDFYVDTVTTATATYQRDYANDTQSAYAWTNLAASPHTIFTSALIPDIGSTAGGTVNGDNVSSTITAVGEKYQFYYQKKSDELGDWSTGFRLNIGPQGPQGEQGIQGERGPAGENASVTPDLEFLAEQDENNPDTPYISDNALIITGTKPIAEVLRYVIDTNNPDHLVGIRANDEVTIRTCFNESHTIIYFDDATDFALGGRVRFAQGIAGVSPYQEYLAYGGTDTYLQWYARMCQGIPDAPSNGKFYVRKNGAWVELPATSGGDEPTPVATDYAYYGYVSDNTTYAVSQITATMAGNMTKVAISSITNPVTLSSVPAGAVLFVAVPSGYYAAKDDGLGGEAAFEANNGTTGTGANGASTLTIDGVTYKTYGEFRLAAGDALIYIEEA